MIPGSTSGQNLNITLLEGADSSHRVGTIAYRGFTVQVRDGIKPLSNAAVTFQLPEADPSGTFPSGSRTETTIADAGGRASVWGIRWGALPGAVPLAVIARWGAASAGMMIPVRLEAAPASFEVRPAPTTRPLEPSPAPASESAPPTPSPRPAVLLTTNSERMERIPNPRSKWILIGLGVAGAVGGGLAWKLTQKPGLPGVPPPLTPAVTLVLANPVITVTKP